MTATLTVQRNLNFINAKDHKAQGDGTTDDTVAIAAAMTAANGGPVWLPKGTYKITSPLLFSLAGSGLWGAGIGATILQIAATFSGSAAISATAANKCSIRDMSIVGISSTYSNNPASDAIKINHCNNLETTNVFMQYINGWGIEVISDATADSYFPRLSNLHTSACKQGCHLQGTASPDFNMGAFLANCNFENCQAGDALFIK